MQLRFSLNETLRDESILHLALRLSLRISLRLSLFVSLFVSLFFALFSLAIPSPVKLQHGACDIQTEQLIFSSDNHHNYVTALILNL